MRATLGWRSCDVCSRRTGLYPCSMGGLSVSLCAYCALALTGLGVDCKISISPARRVRRGSIEVDERILARFKGS